MEFIETIEVGARLRVRVHANGGIVLETGTGPVDCSRAIVRDADALIRALEDAQLVAAERLAAVERDARANELIDRVTRQAVFAAMGEVYGKDITKDENRERRLNILSKLAGKRIHSLSDWRGDMTMGDAHRVLDALSTLREARA